MGIHFLLKKEGLENIKKLNTMHINKIASIISEKLCTSFPDLHLSQSDLFIQLSRLDMYTAKMQDKCASAKYVYGNNSIYFNENLNLSKMNVEAMHECIHYIQEFKDQKGKLIKLGLYDLAKQTGLALNEAAVQLMATRTSKTRYDSVTYYGMSFVSESPEYYPLECALLAQMMFFTGDEALYFSTLYGTPIFEKTFSNITDVNTLFEIELAFDKLLGIETDLAMLTQRLETINAQRKSTLLQMQIENKKRAIINLVTKIQNKIIENCFNKKFLQLNTFDDIREFETELKDFRDLLIMSPNYNFYNDFCEKKQRDINFKKDQMIKYGKVIDIPKDYSAYLPVEVTTKKLSKFQEVFMTLKDFIFG